MKLFQFLHKKKSCELAKDRLKLLLISDRVDCSTEVVELIKNDMIRIISKYIEIDEEHMEVQITRAKSGVKDTGVPALFANIPIRSLRIYNV